MPPDEATPAPTAEVTPVVATPAEPSTPAPVEVDPTVAPEPTPDADASAADVTGPTEDQIKEANERFMAQFAIASDPPAEISPDPSGTPAGEAPPQTSSPLEFVSTIEAQLEGVWASYQDGAPASEKLLLNALKTMAQQVESLQSQVAGQETVLNPILAEQRQAAANTLVENANSAFTEIKSKYPAAQVDTTALLRMVGTKFDAYAALTGKPVDPRAITSSDIVRMFEMVVGESLPLFGGKAVAPVEVKAPAAPATGTAPVTPGNLDRREQIRLSLEEARRSA